MRARRSPRTARAASSQSCRTAQAGSPSSRVPVTVRYGIRARVNAFLYEMSRLPAEEVGKYARGLRTGGLVARASGEVSVRDRQRYRYGFNTPFDHATLQSLYKNHGDYVRQVVRESIRLVREDFYSVHYAIQVIERAIRADVP